MLGKTVPEPTYVDRQLDHYVCSAGIQIDDSNDDDWKYDLARLWPLSFQAPRDWSVNHVPVERINKDQRKESWTPTGAFGNIGSINRRDRLSVVNECNKFVSGIEEANSRRLSLAFVQPVNPKFNLYENELDDEPSYNLYKDGEALKAKQRFPHTPRIQFRTEDGKLQGSTVGGLQYREWGTWELMRKQHDKLANMTQLERVQYVGSPLRLTEKSIFFIGNFANHRTSWLIIKVLNL